MKRGWKVEKDESDWKVEKHERDVKLEKDEHGITPKVEYHTDPAHGSLAEMETEMVNAALKRKGAKHDDNPPNAINKRPASALKRPSMAGPSIAVPKLTMKPVKKEPKAEPSPSKACLKLAYQIEVDAMHESLQSCRHDDDMYRNKYCSRAYAAAIKLAQAKTKDKAVITEFAKLQYRVAGQYWEKTA